MTPDITRVISPVSPQSPALGRAEFWDSTPPPFIVSVAPSAPSFFSANGAGFGQIAAVNLDSSLNDATRPVKIGGYVSLYATGEGQTNPAGVNGKLAAAPPYPTPVLPVKVTVGGVPASFTYAGGVAARPPIRVRLVMAVEYLIWRRAGQGQIERGSWLRLPQHANLFGRIRDLALALAFVSSAAAGPSPSARPPSSQW